MVISKLLAINNRNRIKRWRKKMVIKEKIKKNKSFLINIYIEDGNKNTKNKKIFTLVDKLNRIRMKVFEKKKKRKLISTA